MAAYVSYENRLRNYGYFHRREQAAVHTSLKAKRTQCAPIFVSVWGDHRPPLMGKTAGETAWIHAASVLFGDGPMSDGPLRARSLHRHFLSGPAISIIDARRHRCGCPLLCYHGPRVLFSCWLARRWGACARVA